MDYSTYRPSARTQHGAAANIYQSQIGVEDTLLDTPRRLKKKESYHSLRYNEPSRGFPTQATYVTGQLGAGGLGEGPKARKGSIRYAVRRIFKRRSKEQDSQTLQVSPPRHVSTKSETSGLPAQEVYPNPTRDDSLVQRTRSTPVPSLPVTESQRMRSPYAMQFPHSARLKPLDLGNPFAPPRAQGQRRQTAPSVHITDPDATTVLASVASSSPARGQSAIGSPSISIPDVESPASVNRREKRRSRSAGDLRTGQNGMAGSPQSRSEEMRQRRGSLQSTVLRASGFRAGNTSSQATEERERDRTPVPQTEDRDDSATAKVTPAFQRSMSDTDFGTGSALGTELSRDLEDRVARLETGLLNFRGQLQQLSADRNRRTVLIGDVDTRPRGSSEGRTASILATDLNQELSPSNYQYEYMRNVRPSRSPPRLRTPTRTDLSTMAPSFSFKDPDPEDDPFISPSMGPAPSLDPGRGASPETMPQHTFRSLYEMLMDERSARRKLERQLESLRLEITELHRQVSLQSNMQSQRSSYYPPMDTIAGSSRLHALLRDTDASPTSTTQPQLQRDSQPYSAEQQRLVSRFSGSESEMGGIADELQTPYEAYQTPQGEQGRFPLTEETRRGGTTMF